MKYLFAFLLLATPALGQIPDGVLLDIAYPIEGNRSAIGKATAIGPNLVLSADHVIRDMDSSLGPVIAVDRKYDRCLVRHENDVWAEIRRTPLRPGERLFFQGGVIAVQPDLSFEVVSGRAVSGMSGGGIFDSEGRIVSVVSEGEGDGTGRLWGYLGLAEWVDQHTMAPRPSVTAPMPEACECDDCQCEPCECGQNDPAPRPTMPSRLNLITFYTGPGCIHCERWNRECRPTLEAKGWRIETVQAGSGRIPRFEYLGHQWTGYSTNAAFYDELERWIDVD